MIEVKKDSTGHKVKESEVLKDRKSTLVGTVDFAGEKALKQLSTLESPKNLTFDAKPLQVKEALVILLEKVKQDKKTLDKLKQDIKESDQKDEEYHLLLLELLNIDNEEMRNRIEKVDELEKDWVLVENNPNETDDTYTTPSWSSATWSAAKTGSNLIWEAGKCSGQICYRVYVESARIGTLLLLGVMVTQNPLFPVMQLIVKYLILK